MLDILMMTSNRQNILSIVALMWASPSSVCMIKYLFNIKQKK